MILKNLETCAPVDRSRRGLFLVVDGVNGAGKSTLLRSLRGYLDESGHSVTQSVEPGSKSSLGKDLRTLILSPEKKCPPRSELFLFLADRAAHVDEIIRPSLEAGQILLSDRYYYSTLAFQGYGRGMDLPFVRSLNEFAIDHCRPDLVLLLDLPAAEGLRRTSRRQEESSSGSNSSEDRLEYESLDFHERVRSGFLSLAEELPETFLVLDALKSPEEVFQQAKRALDVLLSNWEGKHS